MSWKWLAIPISVVLTLCLALFGSSPTEQSGEQGQSPQKKNTKKKAAAAAQKEQGKSEPPPGATEAGVPILSSGDSYDDFPSIAQTSDGTLYAAYAAYYDGHDQVRIHKRLPDGTWSTRSYVPLVEPRADILMPQLAVDKRDRVWVIWCEQTGREKGKSGDWGIYARPLIGERWGPVARLDEDAVSKPDINLHVSTDANHNIAVVWQAHPENNGDIMLRQFIDDTWTEPVAITLGPASDWYPSAAVDSNGVVWIAFDSYRNGDYDVFLTSYDHGKVGKVIPIATSSFTKPTLASPARRTAASGSRGSRAAGTGARIRAIGCESRTGSAGQHWAAPGRFASRRIKAVSFWRHRTSVVPCRKASETSTRWRA